MKLFVLVTVVVASAAADFDPPTPTPGSDSSLKAGDTLAGTQSSFTSVSPSSTSSFSPPSATDAAVSLSKAAASEGATAVTDASVSASAGDASKVTAAATPVAPTEIKKIPVPVYVLIPAYSSYPGFSNSYPFSRSLVYPWYVVPEYPYSVYPRFVFDKVYDVDSSFYPLVSGYRRIPYVDGKIAFIHPDADATPFQKSAAAYYPSAAARSPASPVYNPLFSSLSSFPTSFYPEGSPYSSFGLRSSFPASAPSPFAKPFSPVNTFGSIVTQ